MKQLHDLFTKIINEGFTHSDRTGVGRRSVYNVTLDFDASKSPLLVNTQQIFVKTAVTELLWMLGGHSRIDIEGLNLGIWKKWAYRKGSAEDNRQLAKEILTGAYGIEPSDAAIDSYIKTADIHHEGSVGNMYPMAWRKAPVGSTPTIRPERTYDEIPSDIRNEYWNNQSATAGESTPEEREAFQKSVLKDLNQIYWSSYDQINEMFLNMKKRPYSSRHRVSAWIPEWIPDEDKDASYNILNNRGALTPCHSFFQFTIGDKDANGVPTLNLFLYQGSADTPVGLPYNIACYTTLLHIFAKLLNLSPNRFTVSIGDAHIYTNQLELVKEQLQREELNNEIKFRLLGHHSDPFSISPSDIVFEGYESHPHIKYPVAV